MRALEPARPATREERRREDLLAVRAQHLLLVVRLGVSLHRPQGSGRASPRTRPEGVVRCGRDLPRAAAAAPGRDRPACSDSRTISPRSGRGSAHGGLPRRRQRPGRSNARGRPRLRRPASTRHVRRRRRGAPPPRRAAARLASRARCSTSEPARGRRRGRLAPSGRASSESCWSRRSRRWSRSAASSTSDAEGGMGRRRAPSDGRGVRSRARRLRAQRAAAEQRSKRRLAPSGRARPTRWSSSSPERPPATATSSRLGPRRSRPEASRSRRARTTSRVR